MGIILENKYVLQNTQIWQPWKWLNFRIMILPIALRSLKIEVRRCIMHFAFVCVQFDEKYFQHVG